MLKKVNEKKLMDVFWRNVNRNSPNEIISLKPGAVSKWIFPAYAGILIFAFSIVWFIHHPETVPGHGVITGTNVSGNIVWVEADLQESTIKKIASGQVVQLRFDDYPSAQFGIVKGSLRQVIPTPADKKIALQVGLANGLTTNRQKTIPYKKGAKIDILIVIKDVRLLEHILYRSSKQ